MEPAKEFPSHADHCAASRGAHTADEDVDPGVFVEPKYIPAWYIGFRVTDSQTAQRGFRFAIPKAAGALAPGLRNAMFAAARGIPDLIGLGRGDPDFPTPPHIVEAASRALRDGYTHYTPWAGLPVLRKAIARKLEIENQLVLDPLTEVQVTNGAQEAAFVVFQALLDPGDEVLIADPHYTSYDGGVSLAGGVVVPVPTVAADSFALRPEVLERYITPKSKLLILVNPNNPTGNFSSRGAVEELCRIAVRHDLVVLSDEIYEKFVYDGNPAPVSVATLPGMRDRTITINGFSKTYAMTGWRLGYIAGPREFIELAGEIKYAVSICAPAATQIAGVAALQGPQSHIAEMLTILDDRRLFLMAALDALGLPYVRPAGGFTVFVNVASTGMDSVTFCLYLLREARVQVFPGTMYGATGKDYVRISFLAPRATLSEAMTRIGEALNNPMPSR